MFMDSVPDIEFVEKILHSEIGQKIQRCFACGTCSSGCPVHKQLSQFDPRKIIRLVLLGKKAEINESGMIWLCSSCYTCRERCPQEVGCAELIIELRNMAAQEGYAPEGYQLQIGALKKFGRIYEIEDFDNKKREKMGLAPLEKKANIEPLIHS